MNKDPFKGTVSSLAFGGDGVIRDQGLVVFTPFTIPNEVVEGMIEEKKKTFARGKALKILHPSPSRIEPRCPYFGVCGGCQLQHIDYKRQLEIKRQWVIEALERIGGFTSVQVAETQLSSPWFYRRHITLTLVPQDGHYKAEYAPIYKGSIVVPEVCPIFIEEKSTLLKELQSVVQKLQLSDSSLGKVTILKLNDQQFAFEFNFKKLPSNVKEVFQSAQRQHSQWAGIVCKAPGQNLQWGQSSYQFDWNGHPLTFKGTGAFIQTNEAISTEIYNDIDSWIQKVQPKACIDLYSGIGVTSLILAKYAKRVVAIELNPEAVKLAQLNLKSQGIEHCKVIQGDVTQKFAEIAKKEAFDTVLLNPPRDGAGLDVMEQIGSLGPRHIAYISCMPPTLARDLKLLASKGYEITSCKPYDMFPQTAHVETVVLLEKRS